MGEQRAGTRHRILVEASRLFAERGYHGTSTRDIAAKVGMRQPSIYKHFDTKHRILAELLDADLVPALHRVRAALVLPGPVGPRLHAYLQAEVASILAMPYDVRGLYNDHVLRSPELAEQAGRRAEIHRLTADLVEAGVGTGELVAGDPGFVQQAITGLVLEAVRELQAVRNRVATAGAGAREVEIADFVLRATLVDPGRLPAVRAAAAGLLPRLARPRPATG